MKRLVIRNNKTIRKKAYEFLRERVLDGEIPPDVRLVESKIAAQIGTSRTPVREALHNLELEGLLKSIPRVGYVVAAISEEDLEEICEIRAVIESLAARRAVKKAQPKLVAELRKNIFDQEEKVNRGEFGVFVELCAQFHETIAKLSDSKRLLELSQTLRRHMLRYRVKSIYKSETARGVIDGHKKILEAIGRGDLDEINNAIHDHMEESREAVVRFAFRDGVSADD
jgi:DNA-binding GntR family transcriptional regulator